uniref:GMC_OxRdtase_N domain-containing protein n=1 Tax=Steinernema glaseri TaxID=37863 RepID=A0A1I7XWC8_9BILA
MIRRQRKKPYFALVPLHFATARSSFPFVIANHRDDCMFNEEPSARRLLNYASERVGARKLGGRTEAELRISVTTTTKNGAPPRDQAPENEHEPRGERPMTFAERTLHPSEVRRSRFRVARGSAGPLQSGALSYGQRGPNGPINVDLTMWTMNPQGREYLSFGAGKFQDERALLRDALEDIWIYGEQMAVFWSTIYDKQNLAMEFCGCVSGRKSVPPPGIANGAAERFSAKLVRWRRRRDAPRGDKLSPRGLITRGSYKEVFTSGSTGGALVIMSLTIRSSKVSRRRRKEGPRRVAGCGTEILARLSVTGAPPLVMELAFMSGLR